MSRLPTPSEAAELLEQLFNVAPEDDGPLAEAFVAGTSLIDAREAVEVFLGFHEHIDPDAIELRRDDDDESALDCFRILIRTGEASHA